MASPLRLRARGSATERRGPVTAAQAELLALDRKTVRPRVCNLSYAVEIGGPLDAAALADAFAGAVARHEPLRTTYDGDEAVVGEGDAIPPDLDGDCIDHARWQREWLESPAAERELEWWLERLRGASPQLAGE